MKKTSSDTSAVIAMEAGAMFAAARKALPVPERLTNSDTPLTSRMPYSSRLISTPGIMEISMIPIALPQLPANARFALVLSALKSPIGIPPCGSRPAADY